MKDYLNLLLVFQRLPRQRRPSTFMEIAGYPHYENVCSNILAFYLDPNGEHGMGDLFLKSFLAMTGNAKRSIPKSILVEREYPSKDQKRIDLVVVGDDFVIGIENKIHHWEANDFDAYAATLQGLATNHPPVKVLLCLNHKLGQPDPAGGFVRRSYSQLWQEVKANMGRYLNNAPANWIIHLNEFMETTSRLACESPQERELVDFFMEHHEQIERLMQDRQRLLNRIAQCVRSLNDSMNARPETRTHLKSRGVCQTNILASHFHVGDAVIGMDLAGGGQGWLLQLFQLGDHPHDQLDAIRKSPEFASHYPGMRFENGSYYALKRWSLHATQVELEDELHQGFKSLISAIDSIFLRPAMESPIVAEDSPVT